MLLTQTTAFYSACLDIVLVSQELLYVKVVYLQIEDQWLSGIPFQTWWLCTQFLLFVRTKLGAGRTLVIATALLLLAVLPL